MFEDSQLAWLKHFGYVWIADCAHAEVSYTVKRIMDERKYSDVQIGPPQDQASRLTGIYGMPRQDSGS